MSRGTDVDTAHAQLRVMPLMFAAYGGRDATVRLLLEKGATPDLEDASGASAVDWASQGGHEGRSALLRSAQHLEHGGTEIVGLAGANPVDVAQGLERGRLLPRQLAQSGVVEDHVRRHPALARYGEAQRA